MPRGFLHLPATSAQVRGGYRSRAAATYRTGLVSKPAARQHLSPPIHPDAERERQGQVALYLLRMHIRYP